MKKMGGIAVVIIIGLFFLKMLSLPITRWNFYQWDFKTYYFAGKAHADGLDPYGLTALAKEAGGPIQFRFRYPPLTLWIFRFFALFDFKTACYFYLALKVLFLGGLLFLWARVFIPEKSGALFVIFSLLAFNTAIFIDILSGNIAVFEQFGLWLAFYCFLKRRILFFCLLVFLVAQFKLTPLFFLVLLLFLKDRKRYLYFFGTIFAFGTLHAASFLADPLYKEFIIYGGALEKHMQSFYSLLNDLAGLLGSLIGFNPPQMMPKAAYIVFVGIVLFLSWKAVVVLRRLPLNNQIDMDRIMIFLVCLVYAITVPRFVAYSHSILIVPAYFALRRLFSGMEGILFFILAALYIPQSAAMPGMDVPLGLFWSYHSVLIALGLWGVYLFRIFQARNKETFALDNLFSRPPKMIQP